MGLFDLFEDAKENVEKAQRAREYRQRAKELVREAEDIYERAYDRTMKVVCKVENELKQHINFKEGIGKELKSDVNIVVSKFKAFDIDSKIERMNDKMEQGFSMNRFQSALDNCIIMNPQIPSKLDSFFNTEDYYEAKRQRDEARRYKEQMKAEREKLYSYKDRIEAISEFLKNEKYELDILMKKIRTMTEELKDGMNKEQFSEEEAQYLKGIQKITESIMELLSTDFLSNDFRINEVYMDSYEKIKKINMNLPDSPNLFNVNIANIIRASNTINEKVWCK